MAKQKRTVIDEHTGEISQIEVMEHSPEELQLIAVSESITLSEMEVCYDFDKCVYQIVSEKRAEYLEYSKQFSRNNAIRFVEFVKRVYYMKPTYTKKVFTCEPNDTANTLRVMFSRNLVPSVEQIPLTLAKMFAIMRIEVQIF